MIITSILVFLIMLWITYNSIGEVKIVINSLFKSFKKSPSSTKQY